MRPVTGSAAKAREFDGIGDGIKKYEPTESGVNTEDGECYRQSSGSEIGSFGDYRDLSPASGASWR